METVLLARMRMLLPNQRQRDLAVNRQIMMGSHRSSNNNAIEVPCLPRLETLDARRSTRCSPGARADTTAVARNQLSGSRQDLPEPCFGLSTCQRSFAPTSRQVRASFPDTGWAGVSDSCHGPCAAKIFTLVTIRMEFDFIRTVRHPSWWRSFARTTHANAGTGWIKCRCL